jgi:hypothetical protein
MFAPRGQQTAAQFGGFPQQGHGLPPNARPMPAAQLDSTISAMQHSMGSLAGLKNQELQLTAKVESLIDQVIYTRQSQIDSMSVQHAGGWPAPANGGPYAPPLPAPLDRGKLQSYAKWVALPAEEKSLYHDLGVHLTSTFDIKRDTHEYKLMQGLCDAAHGFEKINNDIKTQKESLKAQIDNL